MKTTKSNKKVGVKAWAVCFALNEECLFGDIPTFQTRKKAEDYVHQLHREVGGFEDDHHIIRVLITPITKSK
jgi:hypothetical protein